MLQPNDNYRVKLAKGITLTLIEGKHVLFSMKTGDTFGLNESAAFMLGALLKTDAHQAIEAVCKEYDAPPDEIRADLTALANELVTGKLLEVDRPR